MAASAPLASETVYVRALTPRQIAWRRLRRNRAALCALGLLALLHLLGLFAPFLSPYSPVQQNLALYYHPPSHFVWRNNQGQHTFWPEVPATMLTPSHRCIDLPGTLAPLRLFVHGERYRLLGILPVSLHLFGCKNPVFLMGTDALGRDLLSRLLYGSQYSLSVGLIGIAITFALGLLIGGISGYYGGITDNVLMRFTEVLLAVPGFYLLLALAALLPPGMPSGESYILIIAILSLVGWAGLARVIRGIALTTRERPFVEAAKALGVSPLRIIVRHILPETTTYSIVSATLAIPSYILGEAGLSFLGLGIREPTPSWGNMLSSAQNLEALTQYPWILMPGLLIFVTVVAWNVLGDGLRDALDPRGMR